MPTVQINGIRLEVEPGTTVLEAARFLGIPIPTLCHDDGLRPYGACRMCVVETVRAGRSRLVAACTQPAEDGLIVRTHSAMVERARALLVELYVATSPQSKRLQDMAAGMGVRAVRYEPRHETCVQCGLCVRMCAEQMMAGAIGFAGRGLTRHVTRPFDMTDPVCRQCGACLYICPVCELRCSGPMAETTLCSGCLNFATVCYQSYDDAMCFLDPCHACELAGPFRPGVPVKITSAAKPKEEKRP